MPSQSVVRQRFRVKWFEQSTKSELVLLREEIIIAVTK